VAGEGGVDRSDFEAQCRRCDVTFSIETRTCLHCGGATGPPQHGLVSIGTELDEYFDSPPTAPPTAPSTGSTGANAGHHSGTAYGGAHHQDYSNEPIEPEAESPFSFGDSDLGGEQPNDRELPVEDETTSVGRSLIRSLGGFVWILLFIGYSFVQSCGE
jgi:hypothetical protein